MSVSISSPQSWKHYQPKRLPPSNSSSGKMGVLEKWGHQLSPWGGFYHPSLWNSPFEVAFSHTNFSDLDNSNLRNFYPLLPTRCSYPRGEELLSVKEQQALEDRSCLIGGAWDSWLKAPFRKSVRISPRFLLPELSGPWAMPRRRQIKRRSFLWRTWICTRLWSPWQFQVTGQDALGRWLMSRWMRLLIWLRLLPGVINDVSYCS